MRDRYYDWKKKVLDVCLGGARSLLRPEKKNSSHLSGGCGIVITAGARSLLRPEKKVLVVCLAGARLQLQPEKKFLSSVWQMRDYYYDRKKTVLVVCLAGARSL